MSAPKSWLRIKGHTSRARMLSFRFPGGRVTQRIGWVSTRRGRRQMQLFLSNISMWAARLRESYFLIRCQLGSMRYIYLKMMAMPYWLRLNLKLFKM